MTNPTILNNILWSATAETDSFYYAGLYSFNDMEKRFKLSKIEKNHSLVSDYQGGEVLETLKWFSNDYYSILRRKDGRLQFNDMRYGTFRGEANGEDDYIFKFILEEQEDGTIKMNEAEGGPPRGRESSMFTDLWQRLSGI